MALTRITKGVIKPNENYDTHNINSTGIITAIGFKGPFTGSSNIQSGILTATKIDLNGDIDVDGHTNLDNVSIAGVVTATTINATTFAGAISGTTGTFSGNVSIGGTLTYEDVTNIDSVGIITARDGIDCNGDLDVDGHTNLDNVSIAGVTTFAGTAVNLETGNASTQMQLRFGTNAEKSRITVVGAVNDGYTGSTVGETVFNTNSQLTLASGGSQALTISSARKVGIGTDNPTEKLHISALGASDEPTIKVSGENSSIWLRTAGSSGSFPTGGSGNDGELVYLGGDFRFGIGTASKNLIFFNGSSYNERLRIDSSGSVGIGTVGPDSKLHVHNGAFRVTNTAKTNVVEVSTDGNIEIRRTGGSAYIDFSDNITNDADCRIQHVSDGFEFSTGGQGSRATNFTINSAGKVLIGDGATYSPNGLLHIVGDDNSNGPELYLQVNNNNTTDNIGALWFGNNVDKSLVKLAGHTHTANNTADFTVSTSSSGTLAEVLRISSAGLVGIGEDNPTRNLHIDGTAHQSGIIIHTAGNHSTAIDMDSNRSSAAGGLAELNFKWNGTTVGQIGAYAGADTTNKDDGHIHFGTASAGSIVERLRITSGGDILLGTDHATIGANTADGSDNRVWSLCGGSDASQSRGSVITLYGNEAPINSAYGTLSLKSGNTTSGFIDFWTQGTKKAEITKDGHLRIQTTYNGSSTTANTWPCLNITNLQGTYTANNILGGVTFGKAAGHSNGVRAGMLAIYQGNGSQAGNVGAHLSFRTSANGAGDSSEKLFISDTGVLCTGNYRGILDNTLGSVQINGGTSGGRLSFRGTTTSAGGGLGEIHGFWDTNKVASILFHAGDDTSNKDDGQIRMYTRTSGGSSDERLRITSTGIIQCGTSGTLKAEINNAVSGHQFISQCSDNNNGFEVYQQHGTTSTRNTFAVYANTGNSSAKQSQFLVKGDNSVHIYGNKNTNHLNISSAISPSGAHSYGDEARIQFYMYNEVPQFTGNPAATIAAYLHRGNNGFGLRFYARHNAGTLFNSLELDADYRVQPGVDGVADLGSDSRRWRRSFVKNAYPIFSTSMNITGSSFSNQGWYDTGFRRDSMGGLDTDGTYIITAYADTYAAGGGNYSCTYTWIVGIRDQYTNQGAANDIPLLSVTGHSTNNQVLALRTVRQNSSQGGMEWIQWKASQNWTALDNTSGGRVLRFKAQRIGRGNAA